MNIPQVYFILEQGMKLEEAWEVEIILVSGDTIQAPVGPLRSDLGLLPVIKEEMNDKGILIQLAEPMYIDVASIAGIRIVDLG